MTDHEVLHATGVLVQGRPTIAAALMLGVFPQRLAPGLHVRAVHRTNDNSMRALDAPRIEGSVPEMIEQTVDWVARRTGVGIRDLGDGRVINEPEWPPDAVRELVGNALLHRDLSWSLNEPVVITLRPNELVIRNPGGLYGIRVGELGIRGITPARNAIMMSIATHVTLPGSERAVEQLATGIPTVLRALAQRRYPPPMFVDDAVRFTAICRSGVPEAVRRGGAVQALLVELGDNVLTAAELAGRLSRSEQVVRRDLRTLVDDGLVIAAGSRGRHTLFRRVSA
jgi:ATP-dependent DNA helicase RecG